LLENGKVPDQVEQAFTGEDAFDERFQAGRRECISVNGAPRLEPFPTRTKRP